ncbi:hypothetical protein R5R35_000877 [Gryllus longicercus]|uniref:GPN-loop GTPase 2 n=1 Tax=Gryllus longicercus TaxID=2509291 RepID=A0AAN9VWQ3_9ORTH
MFAQVVIGPPGSGKTTYCYTLMKFLTELGRKVAVINLDPANDFMRYEPAVNISKLITLEDVMTNLNLGPNGGLMYCMEFLEKNFSWLLEEIRRYKGYYFIFDCPGQVELYTHHDSMKNILAKLEADGFHLCAVHLVDSHYCSDAGKFISTLLMSLSAMLQLGLPHVNVLSKVDLVKKFGDKMQFGLDFYTEVLDLNYLVECLNEDPFTKKYGKLNSALVSLIEDYSLVSFMPLNIKDRESVLRVKNAVDKANGYIYGASEQRSVQSLLACAVGAENEHERIGVDRDSYS